MAQTPTTQKHIDAVKALSADAKNKSDETIINDALNSQTSLLAYGIHYSELIKFVNAFGQEYARYGTSRIEQPRKQPPAVYVGYAIGATISVIGLLLLIKLVIVMWGWVF